MHTVKNNDLNVFTIVNALGSSALPEMIYKKYGGAMLLGVNGVVVKGHGSSDAYSFYSAMNIVKKKLNPNLDIIGVVLTMFDRRTQLTRQVKEEVDKYFGDKVFKTLIPRNVRLAEAPSHGLTIVDYDGKSKGAKFYTELASEVVKRIK